MAKAVLLLEDGFELEGEGFGAEGEAFGEVVFNTSLSGYQEVLTDPSYRGQIVTMTNPLIGNYGINPEDGESSRAWLAGFVVRELAELRSNWRSTVDLGPWLAEQRIVGIQGVDTRSLTRHLRMEGARHGVISSADLDRKSLAKKLAAAPRIVGVDLVQEVSCEAPYQWTEGLPGSARSTPLRHVVVMDCGVKRNILRHLVSSGNRVTVVPARFTAQQIMQLAPDGVVISNGPGDPEPVHYVIQAVREMIGKVPLFGICLGQQMLGIAMGGRTYKLKFGHHGGNHPVKDLRTGRIAITSQNHGFNVDMKTLPGAGAENGAGNGPGNGAGTGTEKGAEAGGAHAPSDGAGTCTTHVNLYDGTAEGLENRALELFSVQYHPEASPGPHESGYLFARFAELMDNRRIRAQKN
ncbi:MAG TPA: glutamine-hydrolyzing carbamoyl-phosphate synthase small subunit [Spirochaetia bacterium]|nr:glutamine-hydrolyzing carbamoyl-phosphate synthase small subunit [Spirochaetia bacterium]